MIIEKINKQNDIKNISPADYDTLCKEIRKFLIQTVSVTGGHLASNLGVVELTCALHLVCDLPKDKIIWDVGHQSYTHKILTGRRDEFSTLRQYKGLSGFPKREESECDAFDTGHSSTSISAALGMACARELKGEDNKIFAVIGDGALTGGLAFEALNNAANFKENLVIVLNDNNMSISKNVGGLSTNLAKLRTSENYVELKEDVQTSLEKIPKMGDKMVNQIRRAKSGIKQLVIPGMMYEQMGIMYLGPVDGHDIAAMTKVFEEASQYRGPVLVHVLTKKGKGYEPAERHPSRFHGTAPFELSKGIPLKSGKPGYTDVFSTVMVKMGEREEQLVAITAAMEDGVGLARFHRKYPERFFDVGIAEGHGVTFAAGLASEGLIPLFAVYSSFLQRGYDEIIHDVCLQKLHVIFAIDRAGLVGADGDTHQGIFDVAYLNMMPNMVIMSPKNKWELSDMLKFAISYDGPIAIRYPRGEAFDELKEQRNKIALGKSETLKKGKGVLLFALGSMVPIALETSSLLKEKGVDSAVVNARFAKPFDKKYFKKHLEDFDTIVTLEEGVIAGGMGQQIEKYLDEIGYEGRVITLGIDDTFVPHGSVDKLYSLLKLDAKSIVERITK